MQQGNGRRRSRRRSLLLLPVLLTLLLLGTAGPASAHAALTSSDPENGAVLEQAPTHITLTFTEPVGLLTDSFRVLDPKNTRIRTGPAEHAPGRSDAVRVALPRKDLGEGTFTVAWRVVSEDSHPVSGALTFSVGKPSATAAAVDAGPLEDPATKALYTIARYLAYLAMTLLAGTAVFMVVCRPGPLRTLPRLLRAGWWTLLAATAALFLLRAPFEAGTSPADALDPASWARTATTRPGWVLLIRLALLALTALYLRRYFRRSVTSQVMGGLLLVGLALTWAAGEHASAGIQVPAAMTSSVLHVLATAGWLGGLTALVTTLAGAREIRPATLRRFSRLAFGCVTVLVLTGVYQSWRGLGSWTALTTTEYGRLLVIKLTAVVVLLTAAGLSRLWTGRLLTTAAQRSADACAETAERAREAVGAGAAGGAGSGEGVRSGDGAGPTTASAREAAAPPTPRPGPLRTALRRFVVTEVTVGVAVLVITTQLTGTVPGRAEEAATTDPVAVGLPVATVTEIPFEVGGARGRVQLTLDPARVGPNNLQAVVLDAQGGFAIVPEVRAGFSLPAQDIGPLDARLADRGGYWVADGVELPLPGDWEVKVTVRVSDVDQVTVSRKVRIR